MNTTAPIPATDTIPPACPAAPASAKEARKPRRAYTTVEIAKRFELIDLVTKRGLKISKAAKIVDVNYEAAKHILQDYRRTGHCEPRRLRKRKEKYERLAIVARALSSRQGDLDGTNPENHTAFGSFNKKAEALCSVGPEFARAGSETADTPKANAFCGCRDEASGTSSYSPFTLSAADLGLGSM